MLRILLISIFNIYWRIQATSSHQSKTQQQHQQQLTTPNFPKSHLYPGQIEINIHTNLRHQNTKRFSRRSNDRCEKIYISHCQNVGYNQTNIDLSPLNFYDQDEAGIELGAFYELFTSGCVGGSKKTMTLLVCSLYAPTCLENYYDYIPPCQELCLKAKKGCIKSMHQSNIEWPEAFNCNQFPKFEDAAKGFGQVCLPEPSEIPINSQPTEVEQIDLLNSETSQVENKVNSKNNKNVNNNSGLNQNNKNKINRPEFNHQDDQHQNFRTSNQQNIPIVNHKPVESKISNFFDNLQEEFKNEVESLEQDQNLDNCYESYKKQPKITQTITILRGLAVFIGFIYTLILLIQRKKFRDDYILDWPIWILFSCMYCHLFVALIRLPSLLVKFEKKLINSLAEQNQQSEIFLNQDMFYINTCTGNLLKNYVDQQDTNLEQPNILCVSLATFEYFFSMLAQSYFLIYSVSIFITSFEQTTLPRNFIKCPIKVHFISWILPFTQTTLVLIQKSISSKNTFPVQCKVIYNYKLVWVLPVSIYLSLSLIFLLISIIKFWSIYNKSDTSGKVSLSTAVCSFSSNDNGYIPPQNQNYRNLENKIQFDLSANHQDSNGSNNSRSSPNSNNPLMQVSQYQVQSNTNSSHGSKKNPHLSTNSGDHSLQINKISFNQKKYLDLYENIILRLSIFSIGYITFSFIYLFSLIGYDVENENLELNVFLSLIDCICRLILILLVGILFFINQASLNDNDLLMITDNNFQPNPNHNTLSNNLNYSNYLHNNFNHPNHPSNLSNNNSSNQHHNSNFLNNQINCIIPPPPPALTPVIDMNENSNLIQAFSHHNPNMQPTLNLSARYSQATHPNHNNHLRPMYNSQTHNSSQNSHINQNLLQNTQIQQSNLHYANQNSAALGNSLMHPPNFIQNLNQHGGNLTPGEETAGAESYFHNANSNNNNNINLKHSSVTTSREGNLVTHVL